MASREQKIRLFVPTGVYPPDIGGPATYVSVLERYLPAHGVDVSVLPFRIVRHLPKGIAHLMYFFKALVHAHRADVVYAQDAVSVGFPAMLAALITRKPFVVKIVGDHVWEQGRLRFGVTEGLDNFPLRPKRFYLKFLRWVQQMVVHCAHAVIVPSQYLKTVVSRWGIDAKVIHNGIDMPHATQRKGDLPHPLVMSVGRLTAWKGFDGLLDAARGSVWHTAIIGEGTLHAQLEKHARDIGVENRTHFLGSFPREKMHEVLAQADVFVLNSSYEGMPHTLIEAMALGVPVIATDIRGNREVLRDDEGLFVKVGDTEGLHMAIASVLGNLAAARERTARARVHAESFSPERTISTLAKLLKNIKV